MTSFRSFPPDSPQNLIFQELSSFAASNHLNLSGKELKTHAIRIFDRLKGELLTQTDAAQLLGVSTDMLHLYRKDGLITGIPKNPTSRRIHWLYQLTDVLELKTYRARLKMGRGHYLMDREPISEG